MHSVFLNDNKKSAAYFTGDLFVPIKGCTINVIVIKSAKGTSANALDNFCKRELRFFCVSPKSRFIKDFNDFLIISAEVMPK